MAEETLKNERTDTIQAEIYNKNGEYVSIDAIKIKLLEDIKAELIKLNAK